MGFICEKVEQRLPIPGKFVTRDLFNCIDLIAVKRGSLILGVQVTSRDNVNARMNKAMTCEALPIWIACGGAFEIWGYGGKSGKRVVGMTRDGQWMEELCGNSSVGSAI